ncbi:ribonuclease III domain protein [Neisseria meningitidis NM133]|nr:ribonuclease III domain protein [Neisseria meningitidis NM133]
MKDDVLKQQAHAAIQKKLGYAFRDISLLRQALTHRSHHAKHNERFEFVGDSILNYTVARMLFDAFPKLTEGELSRLRASLVNEGVLAEMAAEMNVGDGLYLGAGELKSGGFRRPSILADAMEAMFAAVSFDADFNTAEKVVRHLFADRVRRADFKIRQKTAKLLCRRRCRHAALLCRNTVSKSKSAMPTTVCLWFPAIWANWVSCAVPKGRAARRRNRRRRKRL